MKRTFTYVFLSGLFVFLGLYQTGNAQTTINTTVGSTGYTANNNSGAGSFITFVIENTSAGGIFLTDVGNWVTTAHNGTTSTLYYSATSLSGPVPGNAVPATGFTLIASAPVTGITATGVAPVITGMNFLIPAGATYRFALHTTGTNYYSGTGVGTASPNSFTQNGVVLRTGDYQIAGQYVGYGFSNNPRFFTGFITFIPATPCSGMPSAGTATATLGCPASVSLTGNTSASGLTVQWQKRSSCNSTWTNIAGATSVNYSLPPQTSSTDYRAYIVCLNSNLADTSNAVTVANVPPCYCASLPSQSADEEIFSFSINGVTNAYACNVVAPGPGSILNRYSNFTPLGPLTTLSPGAVVPFTIVEDECDGAFYYSCGIAMWIDFNGDGDYTDLGEQVYTESSTAAGPRTVNSTFTVPANVATGITTGLRITAAESYSGSTLTPCLAYGYGETEDYLVKIAYVPTVTGAGVYCAGQNVTLTASAPGLSNPSFLWTGPNGQFIDTTATLNFPNIQPSVNGFYTIHILSFPCGGTGAPDTIGKTTVSLYVNPVPAMPIVAPIIAYCQGEQFDSIPVFGQNLKWYSVPTGGISSPFPPQINTSTMGSATYYISQTVNNCESPRAPVTINVVPKPAPPVVTTPVKYCQDDVASPLEALGQNIRWYSVPAGGVGTPVTPTPGTNAQGTFTWYATQTVAGCESIRVPVEVTVSYRPNALITVSRPYVCQYDTITLTYFGNALTTADYVWTLPMGATTVSGTNQGPLVVRFDSAGIRTVRLSVDNGGCVGPEARINIPVRQSPLFSLDMQRDACKDEIVNIAVNYATTGIDNYNWNGFAGGEMMYGSLTAGPYGIRWNTPGVKVIEVQATDEICKSIPVFDTITIHELPDATITANTQNICAGDTVEFRGVYNAENSYQWEPFQYFGASHSHIDTGIVDFTTYVKLTVTSKFNCRATDSVLVNAKPCCEIYFPNAFTPNNDGKNDLFRPVTVGTHEISAFRVLNRWGQVIYESRNERGGWDGSFNGKPQDMGTYFYHIKYKCADGNYYEDKGEVTLVR